MLLGELRDARVDDDAMDGMDGKEFYVRCLCVAAIEHNKNKPLDLFLLSFSTVDL